MQFSKELVMAAALVFEAANGRRLESCERSEIRDHGLTNVDASELSRALVDMIESDSEDVVGDRGAVYWALGKRFDQALLPFFRKQLGVELQRSMDAAYQIMIALDNLNEPIFAEERSSYSFDAYDLNRRDADRYLVSIM
jgi:hypothetical protein